MRGWIRHFEVLMVPRPWLPQFRLRPPGLARILRRWPGPQLTAAVDRARPSARPRRAGSTEVTGMGREPEPRPGRLKAHCQKALCNNGEARLLARAGQALLALGLRDGIAKVLGHSEQACPGGRGGLRLRRLDGQLVCLAGKVCALLQGHLGNGAPEPAPRRAHEWSKPWTEPTAGARTTPRAVLRRQERFGGALLPERDLDSLLQLRELVGRRRSTSACGHVSVPKLRTTTPMWP